MKPQSRVPFTVKDEDAHDSVFYWKQRYDEAVDKWIRLDSLLTQVMRESEEKDRQIAFLKDAHDAIRELTYKTGAEEEREACARLLDDNWFKAQSECAAAIRARGEK